MVGESVSKGLRPFVGRENAVKAFEEMYRQCAEYPYKGHVLSFYGMPGVGKSRLLSELNKRLERKGKDSHVISLPLEEKRNALDILYAQAVLLEEQYDFRFPEFRLGLYVYRKRVGNEEKAELPKPGFLSWRKPVLHAAAAGLKIAEILFTPIAIAKSVIESIWCYRAERRTDRAAKLTERDLRMRFVEEIKERLIEADQPLVFLLDDVTPERDSPWLQGIDGMVNLLPNILWVLAGETPLSWPEDSGISVETYLLSDLNRAESVEFLDTAGVGYGLEGPAYRNGLYERTNGLPGYLDLCAGAHRNWAAQGKFFDIKTFFEKLDTAPLYREFTRGMSDGARKITYFLSCFEFWYDEMALAVAEKIGLQFDQSDYNQVRNRLFVTKAGRTACFIHPAVRDAFLKNGREEHGWMDEAVHKAAGAYLSEEGRLLPLGAIPLYAKETLYRAGKWDGAILLQDRLWKHCEGTLPGQAWYGRDLATILAENYFTWGSYASAAQIWEKQVEARKATLGPDHPDTLSAMGSLAFTYQAQGNHEKAAALGEEVLRKRETILGPDHPDTLSAMHNLANTYQAQGKYEKAAALQEEALRKMKAILGEDYPDTLNAMNNLANTYYKQGKYEKAAALEEEVLRKMKAILGEDHPDTLNAMNNLANTYQAQGKYEKAAALREEVLKKREAILGEDHPDTLSAMLNLANTYQAQGKHEKAAALKKAVLRKREAILGEDHPDTLAAMHNLAGSYFAFNRLEEAHGLLRRAYQSALANPNLGPEHPYTIRFKSNLERIESHLPRRQ